MIEQLKHDYFRATRPVLDPLDIERLKFAVVYEIGTHLSETISYEIGLCEKHVNIQKAKKGQGHDWQLNVSFLASTYNVYPEIIKDHVIEAVKNHWHPEYLPTFEFKNNFLNVTMPDEFWIDEFNRLENK